MTRMIAIAAAIAIVALMGGLYWMSLAGGDDKFAQCRGGQIAGGAGSIGGAFELVSETGETVTEAEVIDQPALIYFGYTFCPDVCPIDAARNADAVDILEQRGYSVKPVFISIDPKRDTPQVVADFTANLHPRMLGLTGSPEQVKAANSAFRGYYQVHDDGTDYYLVDHLTHTYFMLPDLGFADFFRSDVSAEQMADRVQCFLDAR